MRRHCLLYVTQESNVLMLTSRLNRTPALCASVMNFIAGKRLEKPINAQEKLS